MFRNRGRGTVQQESTKPRMQTNFRSFQTTPRRLSLSSGERAGVRASVSMPPTLFAACGRLFRQRHLDLSYMINVRVWPTTSAYFWDRNVLGADIPWSSARIYSKIRIKII